jgi:hypothetical protein
VIGFTAANVDHHFFGVVSGGASDGRGGFGNPNDFRSESPPVLSSMRWLW